MTIRPSSNSAPGWVDIGYDIFGASYEDFAKADCLLISGTDPYETKTVVWNTWILKGISGNQTKVIMINPRKTAGAAYAEQHGGLHLDINPGSDTAVHMAIQRVILENGWENKDFIKDWIANFWGDRFRFRPGHAQHALAVANDLGPFSGQRFRRLETVDLVAGRIAAGDGGQDRRHRSEIDSQGRRDDGQARERQTGQDLHPHRKGQLLVE